jgi:Holliday junction resolvase-like predicted endonuclease
VLEVTLLIEELHGKISSRGSNLSDRSEDKLTGDFFGTLRYLPFEVGLKPILSATLFQEDDSSAAKDFLKLLDQVKGYEFDLDFWVRSKFGEIDATLETENLFVGLEMKYRSPLSSDDDVDKSSLEAVDSEQSINQLSRYCEYLKTVAKEKEKFLLFVAPVSTGVVVIENVHSRKLIHKSVTLGLLSWQAIYEVLEKMDCFLMEPYQRLIIKDLTQLLIKKGFETFNGFVGLEEYPINNKGYIFCGEVESLCWPNETIKGDLIYEFK